VDRGLTVFHADVHVQSEDQVGACDQLQIFDDGLVTLVGINLLGTPVGEGVGRACAQPQSMLLGQRNHVVAQLLYVFFRILDGIANARAHLDDGLVHPL